MCIKNFMNQSIFIIIYTVYLKEKRIIHKIFTEREIDKNSKLLFSYSFCYYWCYRLKNGIKWIIFYVWMREEEDEEEIAYRINEFIHYTSWILKRKIVLLLFWIYFYFYIWNNVFFEIFLYCYMYFAFIN